MRTRPHSHSVCPSSRYFFPASLAATMIALSACFAARAGTHREEAGPSPAAASIDSATPRDVLEAPAIVHVVNGTAQPFRVSIVYGGFARTLGSVPGLATRDFVVARNTILGYEEFQLLAALRDGIDRRDSERFSLSGARVVEWTIDAGRTRSVTLR